jgi:hypothetical protein
VNAFHEFVPKKVAFLLFNVGTILFLILSGSLSWSWISLFSNGAALLLMNGIAWISSRNYKDWR